MCDPITVPVADVTAYPFDEHFVSLALVYRLIEEVPTFSRDALAQILWIQFGGIDFSKWRDIGSFYAAMSPEFSEGFRAMGLIAFLILGTDSTVDQIAAFLRSAFDVPGAKDLPEYIEASRRFLAANIPASGEGFTVPSGLNLNS
jgi:hypothetical protein